jgi:hypothetical protein
MTFDCNETNKRLLTAMKQSNDFWLQWNKQTTFDCNETNKRLLTVMKQTNDFCACLFHFSQKSFVCLIAVKSCLFVSLQSKVVCLFNCSQKSFVCFIALQSIFDPPVDPSLHPVDPSLPDFSVVFINSILLLTHPYLISL